MSSSIYQSLMKALTMEYVEDITCYPVCASASGAIAELIEVRLSQCSILHCSLLAPGNMN
jgi:hypothetical protein